MEVRLSHLTKRFASMRGASVTAVDDVSLTIESGELFFLLGPSGCGKTTCLRMVAGFTIPDEGTIAFGELDSARDMTRVPPNRRNTGMVFQNYALWPHMTVRKNVAYGLEVRRIPRDEKERRVRQTLEVVRMAEKADRFPNQLSGGEQQRVALARALVIEPDVLLLDEPLSNLDAKLRHEMRDEIRRIHDELGLTAIYVTHDQKEALSIADRLAVMRGGRLEQVGTPREVYANPANAFIATFLGEANLIRGRYRADGDRARINTACSELVAARRVLSFEDGATVLACVRPEAFRISDDPATTGIPGIIKSITYLGELEQYGIKAALGSNEPIDLRATALHTTGAALRVGEAVKLVVAPEDVAVLPDEPAI